MEKNLRFAERHLVKEAEKRLSRFFTSSGRTFKSYAPENNEQNFFDLGQHCADLIGCVDNWFPLLLEFKVFDGTVLPSFKKSQHEGLKILNAYGIPVRYCFNSSVSMQDLSDIEFLDSLSTCFADPLPTRKPSMDHDSLLDLIVRGEHGPHKLAPLAFCESSVFETADVAELTTARLLLLTDKHVLSLSPEQGSQIVTRLWQMQKTSSRKVTKDWKLLDNEIARLRLMRSELINGFTAVEKAFPNDVPNALDGWDASDDDTIDRPRLGG
jgi:hypothetical protein